MRNRATEASVCRSAQLWHRLHAHHQLCHHWHHRRRTRLRRRARRPTPTAAIAVPAPLAAPGCRCAHHPWNNCTSSSSSRRFSSSMHVTRPSRPTVKPTQPIGRSSVAGAASVCAKIAGWVRGRLVRCRSATLRVVPFCRDGLTLAQVMSAGVVRDLRIIALGAQARTLGGRRVQMVLVTEAMVTLATVPLQGPGRLRICLMALCTSSSFSLHTCADLSWARGTCNDNGNCCLRSCMLL